MTATAERVREIGHPWYDRHAIRGNREIIQYSSNDLGEPFPTHIVGVTWDSTDSMHAYYRNSQEGPFYRRSEILCHMHITHFATWGEAEAWLFAPSGGDA